MHYKDINVAFSSESEDVQHSNYDRLHGSQPILNQKDKTGPVRDGTYDAISDLPTIAGKSRTPVTTIDNAQYASIDQNQAAPPPPPPPPPPSLPGNSREGNPTPDATEVFTIGDIGTVAVGSYQYACVDKSSKEQAPPPPPPPPPPQLDPTSVETFDPSKWAPVADTQYATVDKTRSYDDTPPPPPPPPPPPSGYGDNTSSSVTTNPSRGTVQTSDPSVQLQAAIEALYDSVQ